MIHRAPQLILVLSVSLGTSLAPSIAGSNGGQHDARCAPLLGAEGGLTLGEAVQATLRCNPLLAAADSSLLAASARMEQAAVLPNPELNLELENFAGSGELHGLSAAESTVSIAQPIHLAGTRGRRRALADADRQLAASDRSILERELRRQATAAFHELQAAQQRLSLTRELYELAEGVARSVEARVAAGKVSPVETTRAQIETVRAAIAVDRAETALQHARMQLAASWGSTNPDFERALGELPAPTPAPPLETLEEQLREGPDAARLEREIERRQRSVELEKALGVPSLTVNLGSRHLHEIGLSSWVAGVSLPLPLFDRNQGARRAEELELEAARRRAQSTEVELHGVLVALVANLELAAASVASMSEKVEPAAAEAFAAVETGYRAGKFNFLDLLQAQRALFEARQLRLDSHLEYAIARTELERLVGPIADPQRAERGTP